MSSENQNSIGSYVAFPLAITGAGAVKSVAQNRGVGKAIKALEVDTFKNFNSVLKNEGKDVFSRGIINAENYSQYKQLTKIARKDKLSLFQKIKNLFKSNAKKVTAESVKANAANATKQLGEAKNALKAGTQIAQTATKAGFANNVKSLFKKEAKSKMTWIFTAIEAVPEIMNKIIPAFKEEGFGGGMKQLGKSIVKLGGSFLSFTLGGALGRVLGGAIGTVICPGAGSAVGANIGSMISMAITGNLASKVTEKITGEKEEAQKQTQTLNMEA